MCARGGKLVGASVGLFFATMLAACAHGPPPPPRDVGSAPAAALIGLTPDEIVTRLGGEAGAQLLVNHARLEDGAQIVEGSFRDFIGEACPDEGRARAEEVRDGRRYGNDLVIKTRFRDGRLAGLSNRRGDGGAIAPDTTITLICEQGSHGATGEDIEWALALAVVSPIILPSLLLRAEDPASPRERAEAFASLRLGEPPPGGVDAFAAAHTDFVAITERTDDDAQIGVALRGGDTRRVGVATVRAGRVVALQAVGRCRLSAEGALRCEPLD